MTRVIDPTGSIQLALFQLYKKTNSRLIKLKKKKSDSKNLGTKYLFEKGKMINLNSKTIKYEKKNRVKKNIKRPVLVNTS